nr:F-box domain-containing protein [Tanacetum cinerariifolium]
MFENDNDIDLKLVSDMHTMLDVTDMRIRVRGEPFLEVEKQGYSPEVYGSLKLLKDLRETENAKASAFMRVIFETEIKILEKIPLIVQFPYYWGDTFVNAEKDRPLNALNDQDLTQFLKDVTPWVGDLSRYNKAPDRVHLTDASDIFLGHQRPLRARFPWCKVVTVDRRFWKTLVCLDPRKKEHVELWVNYMWHVRPQDADWAMVGGYFVQLLHQDTIPLWYVDDSRFLCRLMKRTNTGVLHNLILGWESLLSMTA